MIDTSTMTDNDKRLLAEAFAFSDYTNWGKVEAMVDKADSKEAKELLHSRASSLYHTDEFYAWMQ